MPAIFFISLILTSVLILSGKYYITTGSMVGVTAVLGFISFTSQNYGFSLIMFLLMLFLIPISLYYIEELDLF